MKSNTIFMVAFVSTLLFSAMGFASKTNAQLLREFYSNVDKNDFDKAGALLSENIKVTIPFSAETMTKEAYKGLGMAMAMAFPDMKHEVIAISESENTVSFKGIFSGTNKGMLMGNAPTGNWVSTPFMGYCTVNQEGKFTSMDILFDVASFNGQLMKGIDINAKNKELAKKLLWAADEGNAEVFSSLLAINHSHFINGKQGFTNEVIERIKSFKVGFPDIKRNVDEIYADNNTVIVRGVATATHNGLFMDIPATSTKISVPFQSIYQFNKEGKVEKAWVSMDHGFIELLRSNAKKSAPKN